MNLVLSFLIIISPILFGNDIIVSDHESYFEDMKFHANVEKALSNKDLAVEGMYEFGAEVLDYIQANNNEDIPSAEYLVDYIQVNFLLDLSSTTWIEIDTPNGCSGEGIYFFSCGTSAYKKACCTIYGDYEVEVSNELCPFGSSKIRTFTYSGGLDVVNIGGWINSSSGAIHAWAREDDFCD